MSAARYPNFEATMPVNTSMHRITRVEPGAIVSDDDAEQLMAAECCTELGADEPCRPPFSRVGLVLMLCTGLPLLVVICWALVAWMQPA